MKPTEGEEVVAWRVREGDQILMPDDTTWCTIKGIKREPDTGLLFMTFVEEGFARKEPDATVRVRRGEGHDATARARELSSPAQELICGIVEDCGPMLVAHCILTECADLIEREGDGWALTRRGHEVAEVLLEATE